eukprot:TRINITY_DN5215_c0_g1_i1.p1 TRINITY_DN5215_c0_g1~~TRINITY_DN5215_c0_g1_i1.p1  ORF type:complete len:548 (-),score=72.84 TRINITY_DN5215_c0_g1_i1:57-1700(-)
MKTQTLMLAALILLVYLSSVYLPQLMNFLNSHKAPKHLVPTYVPRKYLSFCTMVRDESANIPQWIEYHHMMGVAHFYIYRHANETEDGNRADRDRTHRSLQPYIVDGLVTLIEWDLDRALACNCTPEKVWKPTRLEVGIQKAAFVDCARRSNSEWIGINDVDEYYRSTIGLNLDEFLHSNDQKLDTTASNDTSTLRKDTFHFGWGHFGSSGIQTPIDGNSDVFVKEYIRREPTFVFGKDTRKYYHGKSITRTRCVQTAEMSHLFVLKPECLQDGKVKETDLSFRIHHYKKTEMEYARSQSAWKLDYTRDPMHSFKWNDVLDTSAVRYSAAVSWNIEERKRSVEIGGGVVDIFRRCAVVEDGDVDVAADEVVFVSGPVRSDAVYANRRQVVVEVRERSVRFVTRRSEFGRGSGNGAAFSFLGASAAATVGLVQRLFELHVNETRVVEQDGWQGRLWGELVRNEPRLVQLATAAVMAGGVCVETGIKVLAPMSSPFVASLRAKSAAGEVVDADAAFREMMEYKTLPSLQDYFFMFMVKLSDEGWFRLEL